MLFTSNPKRSIKIVGIFMLFLLSAASAFAQTTLILAPPGPYGTSALNRGPNGSVDFQRTAALYLGSEVIGVPPGAPFTRLGFNINTPAATAATGNIKIYMVNTTDAAYSRGSTWTSIISTPTAMTLVYDGPLTVPATAGTYDVALTTPFAWTGGNFYLAYEWATTTKSAASAVYNANSTGVINGLVTAAGTTAPASLTGTSSFRPALQIGFTTPNNDVKVAAVYSLGKLPLQPAVLPHVVKALIINSGVTAKTNFVVSLAITGANTFNTTATIPSLPSGDTVLVSFPAFTPTATGSNLVTVTVPTDDVPSNNTGTYAQIVTTDEISYAVGNPPAVPTALRPVTPNSTLLAKFTISPGQTINVPIVRLMISFHAPSVGQTVYAVIQNSTGTQIARSPDHVIATADLSTLKDFPITNPPALTAGDYYIGMAVATPASTFFPLGVQDENPQRPGTFYTGPLAGGTPVELNSPYRLIIEPVLSNCVSPATPTLTAGGPTAICTGGSVILTAATTTTGVTYEWYRNGSPIAGVTGATYTATQTGNYTVAAISGTCNSNVSNLVTISSGTPATPTVTAGGSTTFCQGGSVMLTGSSSTTGVTYTWMLDGIAIPGATGATYSATASGNYTVVATGSGSCTSTSTATAVTVNPTPPTPTITQNGGTLTSSSATGNQWYYNSSILPGATGQTLVTTNNGTYMVEVTGANGCVSARSTMINVTNTGIADDLAGMSVQVYPNPASGSFKVQLNGYEKDATVTLYNLAGQQLMTTTVKAAQGAKDMNVKGLAAGTYLLKVSSDKGVQVSRMVIQ